jgi:GTPase-associated system helical domain
VHKYFADWYRVAAIEPHPETLEKRWSAIQRTVRDLDVPDALEVVRLFYGSPRCLPRFAERYRDAFKSRDVTFPMRDNEAELQVLAGATIVALLDSRPGPVADVTALAMVSADCRGLRSGERLADMLGEARRYLWARSGALRLAKEVKTVVPPALDVASLLEPFQSALEAKQTRDPDFEGVLDQMPAPGARPRSSPALELTTKAIQSLAAAITEVATAAGEAVSEQARRLQLYREEVNVLWWLFAEHSRDTGHRMASLPLPAACLVAGKELADLIEVLPGPLAAAGLLDRMLRAVERELRPTTTLHEAINTAPREWRAGWVASTDGERVEDLCPVLCSVRRSLETSGPDDWAPPVKTVTGVDVHRGLTPLDLAVQAYEEKLFVGALGGDG